MKNPPSIPSLRDERPALPSQWELASLAAMIGGKETTPETAGAFVASALATWKQAGALLARESETSEARRIRHAKEAHHAERDMLKGPLKIGNQRLPRVEAFAEDESGRTSLDEFMPRAIGLRKSEDRFKWLRGYVKAALLREHREGPDYKQTGRLLPIGDVPKVTAAEVKATLEEWRKNGIPDAMGLLDRYRRWRLTMETHDKERKNGPHDLKECYESGRADDRLKTSHS